MESKTKKKVTFLMASRMVGALYMGMDGGNGLIEIKVSRRARGDHSMFVC